MRGPLRWAENCGIVCYAVAWSEMLKIAARPPHPRSRSTSPRKRGEVKKQIRSRGAFLLAPEFVKQQICRVG